MTVLVSFFSHYSPLCVFFYCLLEFFESYLPGFSSLKISPSGCLFSIFKNYIFGGCSSLAFWAFFFVVFLCEGGDVFDFRSMF